MRVSRGMLAATAAVMLSGLAGTVPAVAQYGYGGGGYGGGGYDRRYDDDRPRRYDRRYDDDYGRPPPPRRYGRRGGSLCVTARGNCPYPPSLPNTPCSCDIPGFGEKRGAIAN